MDPNIYVNTDILLTLTISDIHQKIYNVATSNSQITKEEVTDTYHRVEIDAANRINTNQSLVNEMTESGDVASAYPDFEDESSGIQY